MSSLTPLVHLGRVLIPFRCTDLPQEFVMTDLKTGSVSKKPNLVS